MAKLWSRVVGVGVVAAWMVGCSANAPQAGSARRASPEKVAREFGRDFGQGGLTGGGAPRRSDRERDVRGPQGELVEFGVYVLALSWTPAFCCQKPAKDECDSLSGTFAGDHLAIHGLWPNYDDAEAARFGKNYPQYCGDYRKCGKRNPPDFCDVDPSEIPAEMAELGPGYVNDGNFLANHEWPKHGSCTGLGAATYFEEAIETMRRNPGDRGTPEFLTQNVGQVVALATLAEQFPDDNVVFRCDKGCVLSEVTTCWANEDGQVGPPIACPQTVIKSTYSNSCATSSCTEVAIPGVDQCTLRGLPSGPPSGGGSGGSSGGSGGKKCNINGKGPSCTSDAACQSQGYVRCAKSGCCTTVPLPN